MEPLDTHAPGRDRSLPQTGQGARQLLDYAAYTGLGLGAGQRPPYNFGFLTLGERMAEMDVHRGLMSNMRDSLTELGRGFAFGGEHVEDVHVAVIWFTASCASYMSIRTLSFTQVNSPGHTLALSLTTPLWQKA